jgi:hypothetical protein
LGDPRTLFVLQFSDETKRKGNVVWLTNYNTHGFSSFLCTPQWHFLGQDYVFHFGLAMCLYNLTSIACTANDQKGWLTNVDWTKSKVEFLASNLNNLQNFIASWVLAAVVPYSIARYIGISSTLLWYCLLTLCFSNVYLLENSLWY